MSYFYVFVVVLLLVLVLVFVHRRRRRPLFGVCLRRRRLLLLLLLLITRLEWHVRLDFPYICISPTALINDDITINSPESNVKLN